MLGHNECIQLLVSSLQKAKSSQVLLQENGVGLTPLDCLLERIKLGKGWDQEPDATPPDLSPSHGLLQRALSDAPQRIDRTLAPVDLVVSAMETMSKRSKQYVQESSSSNKHNTYGYGDQDQRDDADMDLIYLIVPSGFIKVKKFHEFPPDKYDEDTDLLKSDNNNDDEDEDMDEDYEEEKGKSGENDMEDEEEEDLDSLEGTVVAITGSLSLKREEVIKIIKENGGEYSATITKKTTHLVTNDPSADTAKLNKARQSGIKVVGERFLKKFLN